MRKAFDQIGAAIPFRALCAVRLPAVVAKEQQLPARDHKALIERKRQFVRTRRRMNRLPCHQIGIERPVIVVRDVGEMIVGKGRVEMPAVAVDAGPHRAAERGFRPAADAGLRVRRDIRGIDGAERRRHRQAAGKGFAAAHGMTVAAIAGRCERASPLDQSRVEGLRRRRIDCGNRRPPNDRKRRNRGSEHDYGDDAGECPTRCH